MNKKITTFTQVVRASQIKKPTWPNPLGLATLVFSVKVRINYNRIILLTKSQEHFTIKRPCLKGLTQLRKSDFLSLVFILHKR